MIPIAMYEDRALFCTSLSKIFNMGKLFNKPIPLIFFMLLIPISTVPQISNPNSITFQPHDNLNIKVKPIINPENNALPILPANGVTAEKIIKQVNENAMHRMGYVKPPISPSDPTAGHQYIIQDLHQKELQKQRQYIEEIYTLLNEDLPEYKSSQDKPTTVKTQYYKDAFRELQNMQSGIAVYSLKRAIFLIENAWHNNKLNYTNYSNKIDQKTKLINSIAKKEGIDLTNSLGLNYVIQRLYYQSITDSENNIHTPFEYDFDDYMGEKDWSKMFVTKLLNDRKGQCHSLPLLYLILAEQCGAKAWLSYAPEHSFIIFSDNHKRLFYNFETTNGNIVSTDWIMESGFVNTASIRNRIYLDTLGKEQLISSLINDLAMGYTNKFGYDEFVAEMVNYALYLNPKNVQGHILKADIQILKTEQALNKVGNPPIQEIQSYPEAWLNYRYLLREYEIIDGLGYAQMPKEIYEQWLTSANAEKNGNDK